MTAAARHWRAAAVCAQVDPELFFPESYRGRPAQRQVAAAKRVCAGCPVRAQCLSFALGALSDGIAGGLTPQERRDVPRDRDQIAAAAELLEVSPHGTRAEVTAAGRAALRAGRDPAAVAQACGVSPRTVGRWAAQLRTAAGRAAA
ncbi:MAG: WhiB family transcriptional regulator [Pseudonocardia sp.]